MLYVEISIALARSIFNFNDQSFPASRQILYKGCDALPFIPREKG